MPPFLFKVPELTKRKPKDEAVFLQPTAVNVGLRNCCPRCGEGKLFTSILKPGQRCVNCDLDYGFIDAGDGPAVFVILIIGFVVTAMAMLLQSALSPPIWVHMIIWIPTILGLSIWGLQFAKGILIALQYQTKAHEGELEENGET